MVMPCLTQPARPRTKAGSRVALRTCSQASDPSPSKTGRFDLLATPGLCGMREHRVGVETVDRESAHLVHRRTDRSAKAARARAPRPCLDGRRAPATAPSAASKN
jgi:hypothetical protein